MKKRVIFLLITLITVFSIISFSFFLKDEAIIKNEVNLKNSIKNTDLSAFIIDNYKLGEEVKNIDEIVSDLYFEDGSFTFGWVTNNKVYNNKKIKMINAHFVREGTEVTNNGVVLFSSNEVIENLGNNYLKGLAILGNTDTTTYVDRENNIELILVKESIYLKRIDEQLLRESVSILKHRYDPVYVIHSISSNFKTNDIYDVFDYFFLPIYFTVITFPILLIFFVKGRLRRKILILNVSLFILYVLLFWLYSIYLPLMGV